MGSWRIKDDVFGDMIVPSPLLWFSQVMEQRHQSEAPFCRLPSEILGIIAEFVDFSSWASLALVNTDCRQLSRSYRFINIQIGYKSATGGLLALLKGEQEQRRATDGNGKTKRPSLGICVRRMTVSLGAIPKGWTAAEGMAAFSCYHLPTLLSLLSDRITLPHLQLVDWQYDAMPLTLRYLSESSLQHLKIGPVCISEEYEFVLGNSLQNWPLRTLHLEISWGEDGILDNEPEGSPIPLCASILRNCAPTIETLIWRSVILPLACEKLESSNNTPLTIPEFSKLLVLDIANMICFVPTYEWLLEALFRAPLSVLVISQVDDNAVERRLAERGCIPSLETFSWNIESCGDEFNDYDFEFLRMNPQLLKLSLWGILPTALDTRLLLYISAFKAIKSLSLVWDRNSIPDECLEVIPQLTSLEQIHLSAGNGYRFWEIDHDLMRSYLGKLPSLRKIAFSLDTYESMVPLGEGSHPTSYYHNRVCNPDHIVEARIEPEDIPNLTKLWEERHSQRMRGEADKWVVETLKLEWFYFGQLEMERRGRSVVTMSDKRDENRNGIFLQRIFGWEGITDSETN